MASQPMPGDFPASPPEVPADPAPVEEPMTEPGEIEPVAPDQAEPFRSPDEIVPPPD